MDFKVLHDRAAPDWNDIASSFDRWLPHLRPVGDRLIAAAHLKPGQDILDVACGTGEPSLSIARRFAGTVTVTGIDAAEAMIARAHQQAALESLSGISFRVMPGERLDLPSDRFDRIVSRFGLMAFDQPVAGAREMWRVLRPGGRVAIAVWGPIDRMGSIYPWWKLLPLYLPMSDQPPEPKMTALGAPGALASVLREASWEGVVLESMTVTYRFETPLAFWDLATSAGILTDLLPRFSCHALVAFKARALADIATYRRNDVIELPNEALLAFANKPQ